MDDDIVCTACKQRFNSDEGELHPTLDGIHCPHCSTVNLYENSSISMADVQEGMLDALWERHHCPEDDPFYPYR